MNKNKFIIPKSIFLLIILSLVLNILRVFIFGKLSLIYVIWNLFLAFIPFVISSFLLYYSNNKLNNISFWFWSIVWFLFIPNSPYIVTDLIHIGEVHNTPIIYDSFLLFSSALTGLLLGMYSMFHMEKIIKNKYSQKIASISIFIVMFFASFGIFIGRFLRFNSWDIVSKPMSIINGVVNIFIDSSDYMVAILYTLLFLFFISMSYYSWKSTQEK